MVDTDVLPALDELADALESLVIETFGEIIGTLTLSIDLLNLDGAFPNVAPKEMPFNKEVLGSSNLLFRGENKCAIVIFEYSAVDDGSEFNGKLKSAHNFK